MYTYLNSETNRDMSKLLHEKGCVSESGFWWVEWGSEEDVCDEEQIEYHTKSDYPRIVYCSNRNVPIFSIPPKSNIFPAFTFEDVIQKENAVKVWGDKILGYGQPIEYSQKTAELLELYQYGEDWQRYVIDALQVKKEIC